MDIVTFDSFWGFFRGQKGIMQSESIYFLSSCQMEDELVIRFQDLKETAPLVGSRRSTTSEA